MHCTMADNVQTYARSEYFISAFQRFLNVKQGVSCYILFLRYFWKNVSSSNKQWLPHETVQSDFWWPFLFRCKFCERGINIYVFLGIKSELRRETCLLLPKQIQSKIIQQKYLEDSKCTESYKNWRFGFLSLIKAKARKQEKQENVKELEKGS